MVDIVDMDIADMDMVDIVDMGKQGMDMAYVF